MGQCTDRTDRCVYEESVGTECEDIKNLAENYWQNLGNNGGGGNFLEISKIIIGSLGGIIGSYLLSCCHAVEFFTPMFGLAICFSY